VNGKQTFKSLFVLGMMALGVGSLAAIPGLTVAAEPKTGPILPDPAFDRFVDPQEIGQALQSADPAALTDVALQLGEKERVVRRTRKGITAADLFQAALKAATVTGDKTSLERLGKAAKRWGDTALAARIASAQRLTGESRAVDPALRVSAADFTPDALEAFQGFEKALRAAQVLSDREALHVLGKQVAGSTVLPETQKAYLEKAIEETKAGLADKPSRSVEDLRKFARLADPSRDLFKNTPLDINTWKQTLNDVNNAVANTTDPSPRAGRDFTRIHVVNATKHPVTVALRVLPYTDPNTSHLEEVLPDGPFQTYAWYKLPPRSAVYVADTANTYVYYWAKGGGRLWQGKDFHSVQDGAVRRRIGFRPIIINAPQATDWTIDLKD
jgi:hypothetical protein